MPSQPKYSRSFSERIVRGTTVRSLAAGCLAVMLLSGCSSWPDSLNPVEWGKGVADMFSEDGTQTAAKSDAPIPGEDGAYPELNSVPDRPVVSDEQVRRNAAEGLVADRDRASYSQPVRRQQASTVDYRTTPKAAAASARGAVPVPQAAPESKVVAVAPAPAPTAAVTQPQVRRAAATPLVEKSMLEDLPGRRPAVAPAPPAAPVPEARTRTVVAAATPRPAPVAAPTQAPAPVAAAAQTDTGNAVTVDEFQLAALERGDVLSLGGVTPVGRAASSDVLEERAAARVGAQPLVHFRGTSNSHLIAQIQFGNGATGISRADRAILKRVVELHEQQGGVLRVVGHASSRTRNLGLDQHVTVNFKVSEDRAVSVAKALKSFGVEANRLYVGAKGAAEPRYYGGTPAGEAGNRRVEIFMDY